MPDPVLDVRHLTRHFGRTVAVDRLAFTLAPGEILALVGPNGAGKTTTMRCIAGVIPPTEGRIFVGGHDVREHPVPAKKALAYIPDDPKLFDALTVREHLSFFAGAYGVSNWESKADALLDRFELRDHADKYASDLSRGMRQKAAVCAALLHDPSLIMLDEPLTGLDPRGIRTMKQIIRERADAGAGIIISSHLLALVEDLCASLLILSHGKLVFRGDVAQARASFAARADASLEEVFFSATEGGPRPATQGQDPQSP